MAAVTVPKKNALDLQMPSLALNCLFRFHAHIPGILTTFNV